MFQLHSYLQYQREHENHAQPVALCSVGGFKVRIVGRLRDDANSLGCMMVLAIVAALLVVTLLSLIQLFEISMI